MTQLFIKTCSNCKRTLLVEGFYKSKRTKDGRLEWCIFCHNLSIAVSHGADLKSIGKTGTQSSKGYINPGPTPEFASTERLYTIDELQDARTEAYELGYDNAEDEQGWA